MQAVWSLPTEKFNIILVFQNTLHESIIFTNYTHVTFSQCENYTDTL